MTRKFIIAILALIAALPLSAQISDEIDALIEMQIDSIVSAPQDTIILTPEQTWVLRLQQRVDSVAHAAKTTRVTKRDRRGRRYTQVVPMRFSLGCCVYDLTADSMLYELNGQDMMIPASTQKLFISTAALATHGVRHTFDTTVSANGSYQTDSIGRRFFQGDIYLKGGFDPTLTFADVRAIADAVKSLGVDSIDGRIIVDNRLKRRLMDHHGWMYDRIPLNEEIFITPLSYEEGFTSPDVPRDSIWTTTGRGRYARRVRILPSYRKQRVKHPELYFAQTIYKLLQADSIMFSAEEPFAETADPNLNLGKSLLTLRSPISKVLPRMMKRSSNFYAESMLLNLCPSLAPQQWSYAECRKVVTDMVANTGGRPSEYSIVDGSGLSHSNLCTPRMQISLLRFVRLNKQIYEPLYESLPIAGVDGTISDRMRTGNAYRNVRAKTGTVNGVSTLAGYVTASNGHELAFSIMVNNLGSSTVGRALQNEICNELAR
ncbi:MAG: D-alanyl-D-alanine carboxypeptidase/D-alanyl-D-alanine-endopeptidase [Prevotellaceae bacterium]|nr:D-alanyl-D-alanine carboxypeptidase/D-alanyl-D-alanine-endopeptidase [Candidatus Minthosoma caballi]